MGLGWHPIYEIENKHVWNHQPGISITKAGLFLLEELVLINQKNDDFLYRGWLIASIPCDLSIIGDQPILVLILPNHFSPVWWLIIGDY